jgi:hypothetical protein
MYRYIYIKLHLWPLSDAEATGSVEIQRGNEGQPASVVQRGRESKKVTVFL